MYTLYIDPWGNDSAIWRNHVIGTVVAAALADWCAKPVGVEVFHQNKPIVRKNTIRIHEYLLKWSEYIYKTDRWV